MSQKVEQICYFESGKFLNGNIKSFRHKNHDERIYTVENNSYTLYDGYYRGEVWVNNFKELFTDSSLEIYSVINKEKKILTIGDWIVPEERYINITGHKIIRVTDFYISDKDICYNGITMVNSGGRI